MTETTLAERCYATFVASLGWIEAPAFKDLEDGGEAWFAAVNARSEILSPPEPIEPIEYELAEPKMIPVHPKTGKQLADNTPDRFTIRPLIMRDLCVPEYDDGQELYNIAVLANAIGTRPSKLDDVIDPIDVGAMSGLLNHVSGENVESIVARTVGMIVEGYGDRAHGLAYKQATYTLQIEDCGKHMMVDTRTLGKVKVGPYRIKHKRLWMDGREESDEWTARIGALAHATGLDVQALMGARPEDPMVLWEALVRLKKKSETASTLALLRRIAGTSSDSQSETSTSGPSTS